MASAVAKRLLLNQPPTGLAFLALTGGVQTDATRLAATDGDGITAPGGIGVWPAAINRCINGNATSNITGVTDHSSTTTRATTGTAKFGTTSFQVVSGNAAANEGPSQAISGGAAATQYSISAWVWLISGAATVRAALSDSVAGKQGGTAVALTATPQRITVTATTGAASNTIASYIETTVQQAGTWGIGGWHVETGILSSPYVQTDGGTATRTIGTAKLPVAGLMTATQGAIAMRVKNPIVSTTNRSRIGVWGWTVDASNTFRCYFDSQFAVFAVDRLASGSGASQTPGASWAANASKTFGTAWTATQLAFSVDGAAQTTNANSTIPNLAAAANIDLLTSQNAVPFDGACLWAVTFKGVPTNADWVLLNSFGDTVPSLSQLAMLSLGSVPTALVRPAENGTGVVLLPGYFS